MTESIKIRKGPRGTFKVEIPDELLLYHFAGQAMAGILAHYGFDESYEVAAAHACDNAEVLLAKLKRRIAASSEGTEASKPGGAREDRERDDG